MKKLGFAALFAFGLTAVSVSFGSVPPAGRTVSDTAIYQNNSEITTPRQGRLSFDQDLKNLNDMERRYHERLPRLSERPELASPIKRIAKVKYRPAQRAGRAPVRKVKVVRKFHKAERASEKVQHALPTREHGPKIVFPDDRELARERRRNRD